LSDTVKTYSVSELTRSIKQTLQDKKEFKDILIKGEISNLTNNSSGHIYFSLKDPTSILKCVFFSYANKNYKGKKLTDGLEVQVQGSVNVYEPGGYYNLNVSKVQELGQGDIQFRIEKLKKELEAKGIFDIERKRSIPEFILTLGIATSSTGAAVEDIIRIARERYPNLNILIAPCLVQGETAVDSIVAAIEDLNDPKWNVDVIIAGRGGGSLEDLMAFNEEKVVMAFYNSRVPIISAVGHQVDTLLSDFAADLRAPTPTAAAEVAVPELAAAEEILNDLESRIKNSLLYKKELSSERLQSLISKRIFIEPMIMLTDRIQRVDETLNRIFLLGKNNISSKEKQFAKFDDIKKNIMASIEKKQNSFRLALVRVENFSPLETLKRGYSVIRNKNKMVITSPDEVKNGEELEIILKAEKILKVIVKRE
jgi:exodeoxyribonuclease VII large subunit